MKIKIEAIFGNDFAIEKAEEKLKKEGFKFERKIPLKLLIEINKKEEISKVEKIIKENFGYLEKIETLKSKMIKNFINIIKLIFIPKKEKN